MAADPSQLEAALNAIVEPELGLALGELGVLRSVGQKRRRARIVLALPVAAWPAADALAGDIDRVARGPGGRRRRHRRHRDDRRGAGSAPPPPARRHARGDGRSWGRRRGGARSRCPRPRRKRPRGRAAAGVPPARVQDPRHRCLVRQGRSGQVDGDGQPGHRTGAGRVRGRAARCGRVRLLGAQDARHRSRPGHPRRHRGPDGRARRALPLHGLLRAGRPAGDLARPHAAQGDPAVPHRRLLGTPRLRAHRHAPRHRRRGVDAGGGHAPR